MTRINCYRARSLQRRADTIARKMDELVMDIRAHIEPTTAIELSITNHAMRLTDELNELVFNLDALAAEVSR
jgi:hypothetical protein